MKSRIVRTFFFDVLLSRKVFGLSLLVFILVCSLGIGQEAEHVRREIALEERITLQPLPHLEGTTLLEETEGILDQQYGEIERFFLSEIEKSRELRENVWELDPDSEENYLEAMKPRRKSLREMLGLISVSPPIVIERRSILNEPVLLEEVDLRIDGKLRTRLLTLSKDSRPTGAIIVTPDAYQTPEELLGIAGEEEIPDWVRTLVGKDVVVCVPLTVQRTKDHPLSAQLRGKDRRHILHRLGFIVGRHLVGLEVQQMLGAAEYLRGTYDIEKVAIAGSGQGGMTALYAAASSDHFDAAGVVDYFQIRDEAWKEPVDRMLYGQIREFGDAEVAALVAPRPLFLVTRSKGPDAERVKPEISRASRFYSRSGQPDALKSFETGDSEGLSEVLKTLGDFVSDADHTSPGSWSIRMERTEIQNARDENFAAMKSYLDELVALSSSRREERWGLLETVSSERARQVSELRADLSELMGEVRSSGRLNPKSRLIGITDAFSAYEVTLNVRPGLHAFGQLLIPRNSRGRRMPAVVCQHGLGGSPEKATGFGYDGNTPYHVFGVEMARQGFVVFAPYVTVPVPQGILINRLVRQAGLLGMMRTSVEQAKLKRIVDFLEALPQVDSNRLGYYGISYGGYSAIWMSPLEPRLKATVVSGHFNDWESKITNEEMATSYLSHPDEDFYNWNVLHRFTHRELISAMWPRAVMIEYGGGDTVTPPEWHRKAWNELMKWVQAWDAERLVDRLYFDGVHEIHGVQAFDFLDFWLRPEETAGRDYIYDLTPVRRDLPGIGDTSADTLPYITHTLDADPANAVRGTFYVSPEKNGRFAGLELRLSRVGNPGDLIVRFGTGEGKSDLGEARITSSQVHPLYDLHHRASLEPLKLDPEKIYHFEITADAGWVEETDYYVLYGPRPLGGRPILPAFGLSFRVLTEQEELAMDQEPRFEFVREYLDPFTHEATTGTSRDSRDPAEIEVTPKWSIQLPGHSDEVITKAADDFSGFFEEVFGIAISRVEESEEREKPAFELILRDEVDGVDSEEGFRIEVLPNEVRVEAEHGRGIMRGIYHLESTLRRRGGPFIEKTTVVRNARFSPRITMPVLSGGAKYTETSRPLEYTDGLLRRISHDGFNTIWIWMNVEEATLNSEIFPEFNDPFAAVRFARIKDVSERAKRFGIDVYLYLATGYHHHIPDRFYERHPELKGYGWGSPLCTSQESVRDYYSETVSTIFEQAPEVEGLVVIYDSEGFYYCGNRDHTRAQCPRCRNFSQQYLANQLLRTLKGAMERTGGEDKEFIAWNYNNQSEWVLSLYPMLPQDIVIQSNFSKGTIIERDGIEHRTGDYNITSVGPPDLFLKFYEAAREAGLRMMVKTEHAISQEAIYVPYIPVMEQWYRRIASIRDFEISGWFGNWSHYGYTPHSRPGRLINRMSFDPAPSGEALLAELAEEDFGVDMAPIVQSAWHDFSEAIRQFPYSDPVARIPGPIQKGPSHPLFFNSEIPSFGRWRAWQNDLGWAEPWGVEVTVKYLRRVLEGFEEGSERLLPLLGQEQVPAQRQLAGETRIVRTIISSLRTILNLVDWLEARDLFLSESSPSERLDLIDRLEAVVLKERENALAALPLLERDSRLGYASEGGGVVRGGLFSAPLVRWKIGQLENLLLLELPQTRNAAVE